MTGRPLAPCLYDGHRASDWADRNVRHVVCGTCHPPTIPEERILRRGEPGWELVEKLQHRASHTCPVGECPATVADDKLMCARHWRLVPIDLGRALYRAWRGGAGAGTEALYRGGRGGAGPAPEAHQRAMGLCIDAVQEAIAA
jgi:hypothetical protein